MATAESTFTDPVSSPTAPEDQDIIPLDDLARAVLDRSIRPRAAAVRRLAEGVLARAATEKTSGKKKGKKKEGGKKRKLAKIPGQKA